MRKLVVLLAALVGFEREYAFRLHKAKKIGLETNDLEVKATRSRPKQGKIDLPDDLEAKKNEVGVEKSDVEGKTGIGCLRIRLGFR